MKFNSVIESLTNYLGTHPDIKTKQTYEIYNSWVMTTGIIIKNVDEVQWIMNYIDDMISIAQEVLADAIITKQ